MKLLIEQNFECDNTYRYRVRNLGGYMVTLPHRALRIGKNILIKEVE